jgi:D-sedoheptulose 7-phosphate isomerase
MLASYVAKLQQGLSVLPLLELEQVTELLFQAILNNRKVFVFGNGGSGATATHMAADIGKLTALDFGKGTGVIPKHRLRIFCLNENTAWMTAISNDLDFGDVFLEQLKNVLDSGDIVIAFSGSGCSPNVLRALDYALVKCATTVCFTSCRKSAEEARARSNICVQAPTEMMEQIEDIHLIFHHMIARNLLNKFASFSAAEHI